MDQPSAVQSGGTGATAPREPPCKASFFQRGSEAARMLGRISTPGSGQGAGPATAAERKTMSRLVKAGLVAVTVDRCSDCSCTHARYSLTLAGRASNVAAELGLSFRQLCYLAFARAAKRRSIITGEPEFYAKDVDSKFAILFPGISPLVTRKELAKKGFLVKHAWHTSGMTARFAELERHAAVVDELYLQLKEEYQRRIERALQDPSTGRIVSHFFLGI
jgi:hypothetical protein